MFQDPSAPSLGNDSSVVSHVTSVSVTEPVTPVNKKCLMKAVTPPVTIKNFFKPAKMLPSDTNRGSCCSIPDNQSEASCTTSSHSSNGVKSKLTTSVSVKRPLSTNSDSQSKSKRAKQSSITSLFAKGNSGEENEGANRKLECPICAKEFQSSSSNAEINKHIDMFDRIIHLYQFVKLCKVNWINSLTCVDWTMYTKDLLIKLSLVFEWS